MLGATYLLGGIVNAAEGLSGGIVGYSLRSRIISPLKNKGHAEYLKSDILRPLGRWSHYETTDGL